jgi:hypothetical protein
MDYYVITEIEIQTCSDAGIVACWNDDLQCPIVSVTDESAAIFSSKEVVTID